MMAAPCRIIRGKSFCVNLLLTSSRNSYFVDSSKFYHPLSCNFPCCVKKDSGGVLVVPVNEKFEGNSQSFASLSPGFSCKSLHQSNSLLMILKRFSSHNLLNQDSLSMMSPSSKKSIDSESSVNVKETPAVATAGSKQSNAPSNFKVPSGRPTEEQVAKIAKMLTDFLPRLFVETADYENFAPNLVIEDNIRHTRTKGLYHLVKTLSILRIIGHFKFAYVKFNIIKLTTHPEEGCVKVRWRVTGISTWKALVTFWKIKAWKRSETIKHNEELWIDGFSIFYVRSDGLIHKIIVDKLMPDEELKTTKDNKIPLAGQLAIVGVSSDDLHSLGL